MVVNAIEKLKQSNDMIDGDWELGKRHDTGSSRVAIWGDDMGGLKDKKSIIERSMKKRVPGKETITCKGPKTETERKAKPEMIQEQKEANGTGTELLQSKYSMGGWYLT